MGSWGVSEVIASIPTPPIFAHNSLACRPPADICLAAVNLAPQISCMSGFAAAGNMAAFNAAWFAVRTNVLAPMGLAAEQLGVPLSPPDNFALAVDMRNKVMDGLRPHLDRQIVRFVDSHQPLTSETFESEGFEGPVGAVLLADRVYDHGVVSFDPAKMFIASALMLLDRSPVAISHVPLKYGSRGLEGYRYTYHPMEEMRIQTEIDRLRVDEGSLDLVRIPHISRGALLRIIEQLARAHDLFHPRLLKLKNFEAGLQGWNAHVYGLYKFYWNLLLQEGALGHIVDFMLDDLSVERPEQLSLAEQARILGLTHAKIKWDRVSPQLKAYLLFRLAEEAGVVHPRFLTVDHFRDHEIEELGSTLTGLYRNHSVRIKEPGRAVEAALDDAGVTPLENLPWDVQLTGLRQRGFIKWDIVPLSTQRQLLETARDSMPAKNGLKCPHVRVLNTALLKNLVLEGIGVSLAGLLAHYEGQMPPDYDGTVRDFMLDRLGVEKFEELPYELQCRCLRYDIRSWDRMPRALILRFMERLQEIHGLPHVRFVSSQQMQRTIIPELGQRLDGLYHRFRVTKREDDTREIVDIVLDHVGAPKFKEMPLDLQLQWTQRPNVKITTWRRVPEGVIRHYLLETMRGAGVRTPDDIFERHFHMRAGGKDTKLVGLYNYLRSVRSALGVDQRTVDWAFQRYGVMQFSMQAKRSAGARLLERDEKRFLLRIAKMGDRAAMDHLVHFYRPLIESIARRVLARWPASRLTIDELVQAGRIGFAKIVELHDPARASLETHVKSSLPRRLMNAIRLAGGSKEVSLFDPMSADEDGLTYESVIEDVGTTRADSDIGDAELREYVYMAMGSSGLNEDERFVLIQRGLEGHTLEEVGRMLDLSRERIRQLAESAMRKIANGPYAAVLKELL